MIVLIDMDGVIADFELGFLRQWKKRYPDKIHIPIEQRNTFSVLEQYSIEHHELIRGIFHASGFIRSLPVIPGSVQALHQMRTLGFDVFICTSPFTQYKNCVLEKYEWINEYFGSEWTNRIILTNDKTLIQARYLVDDKPTIEGLTEPTWEHILFDTSRNRTDKKHKRINWDNWRDVLLSE